MVVCQLVALLQWEFLRVQFYDPCSIYVNDLPNVISSSDINMHADDTELYFNNKDLSVVEKTDVNNVSTWLVVS